MRQVRLGNTGIVAAAQAFGALPVQRRSFAEAERILRRALDGGMDFFDTARYYTDSEEKIGRAISDRRGEFRVSTKTGAQTGAELMKDLETSLRNLRTDHIDIYQFHNPPFVPRPGDGRGLYEAALKAKEQGKILHIGITNHQLAIANEAIDSGLFETLQFPFSYLSAPNEQALVRRCAERGMGFIAMKGLCGGLLTNSAACAAFMSEWPTVLPIWGVQHESELEEWLGYLSRPPVMDEAMRAFIEADRAQLGGEFCRSCGYCMPCPAGIEIRNCARMIQLLRRMPSGQWLNEHWQAEMKKIEGCLHCGRCVSKCPYHLNTPELLRKNYDDYQRVLRGEVKV